MSTYLIASNEMMSRVLARRLHTLDLPGPITCRTPQWLQASAPAAASAATAQAATQDPPTVLDQTPAQAGAHRAPQLPPDPADIAVIDCSGLEGDPRAWLDQLHARLAPRRWLVLSDRLDPALILHAALLGASGCLALPAAVDLVCAATALVWAGGQCFPRMALSLGGARASAPSLLCATRPTTTG
ncbi:DNA-binding response regulator [Cupriavidus taiwanensis]|uniref:DNA-binding response regulator n=1 Tax=Cupriavidus taiwanensis TaxID=164546 RepID=UPI00253FD1A7|nr:DNA-binding response regulator [Cupriavidus taiwanensis]MDK3023690.1 DNA-binding response regulator [Cupriavidus taiwanensis]